jgi:hypothetical protein
MKNRPALLLEEEVVDSDLCEREREREEIIRKPRRKTKRLGFALKVLNHEDCLVRQRHEHELAQDPVSQYLGFYL